MLLFLGLLLAFASAQQRSYAGYQVLRVHLTEDHNLEYVLALSERALADVWSVGPDHVDVMVSPQQMSFFQDLSFGIHVSDVQADLDVHFRDNEEAAKKKPVGAKAFPFTNFPRTNEVRNWLRDLERDKLGEFITIGKTHLGHDIFGLSFGADIKTTPTFYIHCTIHAREWITTTTCAWIIDQLTSADPEREKLLSMYHWIIVPIHNIDGYDYTHTNDRMWRKNRQPNSGSTCVGTDINRNYPYRYGGDGASTNPCSETYRGTSSLTSPEARDENVFIQNNITGKGYKLAAYFDIHSYGGYYLSAWGYSTTIMPPDYSNLERVMRNSCAAIRAVNGRQYTFGASGKTLYITSGTTVDTLYGVFQVPNSYTIECFGSSFTPPTSWIEPIGKEVWAGVKYVAEHPNGF